MVNGSDQPPTVIWSNNIKNSIQDITLGSDNNIWVIVEGSCEELGAEGCLWIGQVQNVDSIKYMIGQKETKFNTCGFKYLSCNVSRKSNSNCWKIWDTYL